MDVGFNGSVLLPPGYMKEKLFNDSLAYFAQERLSTGFASGVRTNDYRFLRDFRTGCLHAQNVKSSTTGNNDKALIGNEFLENYTVVMDFIHRELILIPVLGREVPVYVCDKGLSSDSCVAETWKDALAI